ncbi:MAG: acyltransferase family protein [Micrococcales bacterium]
MTDNRNRNLDGLRGLSAIIVVVHHILLTNPAFSDAFYYGKTANLPTWIVAFTPLRLFWDGPSAVAIFFMLSAFVLTGLFPKVKSYKKYALSRMARLYIPSVVVSAAAILANLLFAGQFQKATSSWLASVVPASPVSPLQLTLLGVPGLFPLWSTRLEIVFSLAIGLGVVLATRARLRFSLPILLLTCALGYLLTPWVPVDLLQLLRFGAVFFLGSLAWRFLQDTNHSAIKQRLDVAMQRFPHQTSWSLLMVGLLLSSVGWFVLGNVLLAALLVPLSSLGLLLVLVAVASSPVFARFFGLPWLQWLGANSFSLYLVHGAVVYFWAFLLGAGWLNGMGMFVLALGLTWVVQRFITDPAHQLARQVLRG